MVHDDFIKTSVTLMMDEVCDAMGGIEMGLETYPLCDYIMQSLFLRMTGFMEQKMKCICWEVASVDFEFRRETYEKWSYSECSTYKDKNDILKKWCCLINQRCSDFSVDEPTRKQLLDKVKQSVERFFQDSNMKGWSQKSFNEYEELFRDVEATAVLYENNGSYELFRGCNNHGDKKFEKECSNRHQPCLRMMYQSMYINRNRLAHNSISFQQNLPCLETLAGHEFPLRNYFIHFALLILIDECFMYLFDKWINVI